MQVIKEIRQEQTQQETITLEERINSLTKLQRPYIRTALHKLASENPENAKIICDYITNDQIEYNIKESTKEGKIKVLIWLSNHFHSSKSYTKMNKDEILSYLHSLRKPVSEDPKQKWIGSYNIRQLIFYSFFKWLNNPSEPDQKKRQVPDCINGIKRINRKEIARYNPSDIWDIREHSIFLKYCPSKRDRCYHAMAMDTAARPHELLNLKIKDIIFRVTEDGKQYAEIEIKGGKTGSRNLPIIDSLPYLKDWIQSGHPQGQNPDSWLFVSLSKNAFGLKLTYDGLANHYQDYYKRVFFPNLLVKKPKNQRQQKDEDNKSIVVSEQEKSFIKNMLTKPWNLYIFRHSSLTEKSQILKEHVLRNYAGWRDRKSVV